VKLIFIVAMMLVGTLGGQFSARMLASGKAAIGLGVFPLLGIWLTSTFC
jgi:hypothetical protein